MKLFIQILLALIILLAIICGSMMNVVSQHEQGLLLKQGKTEVLQPGVYWSLPLVSSIKSFDMRQQTTTVQHLQFTTKDNQAVIVGLWWQWQISDVSAYYQATQNNAQAIETQLQDAVSKNLQATFKQKTLSQWLNADYNSSLLPISQAAVKSLGVKVIAVGVTDMDLSKQSTTTANTRQAKAENDAAAALQEGSAARAQAISAAADAKAQLIIANAQIEADKIRAAGSQQASAVYLAAYQAAPEFYNFYQTLQAYKKALTNPNAVFILPPSGDFFKYLNKVPASAASGSH